MARKSLTTEDFITRATKVHGNRFDYTFTKYTNKRTKVTIICRDHGVFSQNPEHHWNGNICKPCSLRDMRVSPEDFITRATKVHNHKYDYSLANYTNGNTKVNIGCPDHGVFLQRPASHLLGTGCPSCKASKGELKVRQYLLDRGLTFKEQACFDDCLSPKGRKLKFDFFIPTKNILIEFDGQQHFEPISFGSAETPDAKFVRTKISDEIKTSFALQADIKLIRIPYTSINDVGVILDSEVRDHST